MRRSTLAAVLVPCSACATRPGREAGDVPVTQGRCTTLVRGGEAHRVCLPRLGRVRPDTTARDTAAAERR